MIYIIISFYFYIAAQDKILTHSGAFETIPYSNAEEVNFVESLEGKHYIANEFVVISGDDIISICIQAREQSNMNVYQAVYLEEQYLEQAS